MVQQEFRKPPASARSRRLVRNLLMFSMLWWLLTSGDRESWIVGGPTVVVATALAQRISAGASARFSLLGCVRFIPYFLRDSLLGGLDVAWRSLHPRLPIDPQLIEYQLRLPAGTARLFFLNVINLLPGTVSADVRANDTLVLHVIDGRQPIRRQLADLEQLVARVFATRIDGTKDDGEASS